MIDSARKASENPTSESASIDQHLLEMQRNREAWDRKPALRKAYANLYRLIQIELADISGPTVELGSGIGAIKQTISECITTDIFPNPWLDRTENAYRLSFEDQSLANLILFDVFHHLEFPGEAFKEFERVLAARGRLIIMEPGFGWLGRFIYGRFHHEPLGFDKPIPWDAADTSYANAPRYYAAQANAWRIFVCREISGNISNWRLVGIKKFAAVSYVASGGFSGPALYPDWLFDGMLFLDRLVGLFPSIFATRLMVVLEKTDVLNS
jgi:SAM-dependent methyltransferase